MTTLKKNGKTLYIQKQSLRGRGKKARTLTYEITRIQPHRILGDIYWGVRVFAKNYKHRTMLPEKIVATGPELERAAQSRFPRVTKVYQ